MVYGSLVMVGCTGTFFQMQFLCLSVKMCPLKLSVPPMEMPGLKLMENSILQVRLEHLCLFPSHNRSLLCTALTLWLSR